MKKLLVILLACLGLTACNGNVVEPKGISRTYVNDEGYLMVVYTDGSEENAGYVKGEKGEQGIQGVAGTNGKDGVDGKDGIDGKDGKDGRDGLDGQDGKDGIDGRDGVDGQDGKDGSVVYIEVDKHITLSNPTTYGEVNKAGTHFDYLLVWNASDNTAGGCYDSYVLPYEYEELPGGHYNYMKYTNYSCFNYKANEDYSKHIVDCTNRTSPGRYLDPKTGREMDWEDSPYGMGVYILTNANIYSCHQSTMCTYGGVPVSQVLITYDKAYTPLQFIESL